MGMHRRSPLDRPARQNLAVGIAATLTFATAQLQAQSFLQSGANSTSPVNLLPFAGNPATLDFNGNTLNIGQGAAGSFSVLSGALLKADALYIANDGTGNGSFVTAGIHPTTGERTRVELAGTGDRLRVGNWGVATMTVSGGALVDAALNPGSVCCTAFDTVGYAFGSSGTLTIDGSGSELRARNLAVGLGVLVTQASGGFDFGTPGGTTSGVVNVLNGGTLRTQQAGVGMYSNFGTTGGERALGTVLVSGVGSQWLLTPNSVDTQIANMQIGLDSGGSGTVTVSSGGKVDMQSGAAAGQSSTVWVGISGAKGLIEVSGTGSSFQMGGNSTTLGIGVLAGGDGAVVVSDGGTVSLAGQTTSVDVGRGGKGVLLVTGAGSSLAVTGLGSSINVGLSAGSEGSFNVLAGAVVTASTLRVSSAGATGMVQIDGSGSLLQLSRSSALPAGAGSAGTANVGIGSGGSGQVSVSNGAVWRLGHNGTDVSVGGGPQLTLGIGGGNGKLSIASGALVELAAVTINPPPGAADNGQPSMSIGREGSRGELTISGGGRLLLSGDVRSTPAFPRVTALHIGGNSDTVPGGSASATVSGAGSAIRVIGADGFVTVGRNGTGVLQLSDQATLETSIVNVGRGTTATSVGDGTLSMDNSTMLLNGQWSSFGEPGAGLSVGQAGGTGRATLANGSVVTVTNLGSSGAGLNLGGTSTLPLGNGTLTMSGGSSITLVTQPGQSGATIGRDGTGSAMLSGASFIDIGTGSVHVGRLAAGVGSAMVQSGSKILAGQFNIGGSSDTDLGGNGSVTASGLGSELRASGPSGFVGVGRRGTGALTLENQAKLSAIVMNVGRSAGGEGVLTVDNATLELSGQQTSGNLSGAGISIGNGGGNGVVGIGNGSRVNITNSGSDGAFVTIGGSGNFPLGTGALALTGGSELRLTGAATPGSARINVGRDGAGTAIVSGASMVDVGSSGDVFVGRFAGSVGTMIVSGGSTINAGYVGVGTSQPYDGNSYNGGTGILVLNDSTIDTGVFELGANGVLTGNNGTVDAPGGIVIGGVISPGNSPGRLRLLGNVIMLAGSKIILEVSGSGGDYQVDQLIIGNDATFDLASAEIVFSFLGNTNPNEAAAAGALDLDKLLRTAAIDAPIDGPTQALSTRFSGEQKWADVVNLNNVSATSEVFNVTEIKITGDGTFAVAAVPVPEPSTWGLMFAGLCAVGSVARRRRAQAA